MRLPIFVLPRTGRLVPLRVYILPSPAGLVLCCNFSYRGDLLAVVFADAGITNALETSIWEKARQENCCLAFVLLWNGIDLNSMGMSQPVAGVLTLPSPAIYCHMGLCESSHVTREIYDFVSKAL